MAAYWSRQLRLRVESEDPAYHGLKKLKLRGKELSDLPYEVFSLLELEVLDLSPERQSCLAYRLSYVPPEIGRLVNLKVLMLDTNDLREIPPQIALLRNLERIALSNNSLSQLPAEFSNLKSLKSLHIANNEFVDIPLEVCELEDLEFLDFSDNQIHKVPDEISKLAKLETLLLPYNKIKVLPDGICRLVNLRSLWLGKNKLKSLPKDFGNLVLLDWGLNWHSSILDGNPLISPPLEVCRLGPVQIGRYFNMAAEKKKSDSMNNSRPSPPKSDPPATETARGN
ncbi:leucine-rich repeat and death domain-containing protein 1-like [Lingula anatina]|uniref:Leucine-rich repeat and death domain-containing protein 1-like n=1 Tax=Lingula anatina TaxID=7574 RepID=A0A1S3IXL8_LINAN|nr:leucine-rich repeat and death domain-containing protein 1-like [Lingula anatina]|eukprot:XP_013402945.1 leucine-rich repeat and death domain-containing protein 1-like [Lingula anatina]